MSERLGEEFSRARKTVSDLLSSIQDKIRSVYNRILKYIKQLDKIIIVLFIAPLIYARNPYEYILHFIWLTVFVFIGNKGTNYLSDRVKINLSKASERELNAEDNVLLRGIGLFQVVLFLYIGYIEDSYGTNVQFRFLRWTIPLFIFVFFIMRGYAHIKNSPKYRTYSSLLIIYYLIMEIAIFAQISISSKIPIMVGDVNLIEKFFTFVITVLIISLLSRIRYALAIRYNYRSNGHNS